MKYSHSMRSKRVLWFLCSGHQESRYLDYIKAAVASGLVMQPALYPVIVISGYPVPDWLKLLNESDSVLVINHNLTFADRCSDHCPAPFRPAYLRIDIPNMIDQVKYILTRRDTRYVDYNYVLYTDTDVIIHKFKIYRLPKPRTLLIGPENSFNTKTNSGVLYMNMSAMKHHLPKLLDFADSKNWSFSAWDQGLILEYFANISQTLPDEYNWKPYWGINNHASIIHFHGPKPVNDLKCIMKHQNTTAMSSCLPHAYTSLLNHVNNNLHVNISTQIHAYEHYYTLFNHYMSIFHDRFANI